MRLIPLLPLLLTMHLAAGAQATPVAPPDSSTKLRQAADKLLATGSSDDAVKAADLLDKASEINAREEAAKKPAANSGLLASLIALTPTLSVFALVFNYWLTNKQTRFNNEQAVLAERDRLAEAEQKRVDDARDAAQKREDEEKQRFTDAITLIQKVEDFSPSAAVLSTFANGPYAERARQTGTRLLLNTKSMDNFADLFNSFVEPVSLTNLSHVVDIFRSVSDSLNPYLAKSWVNGTNDIKLLSADEQAAYNILLPKRGFLGNRVATVLRQHRESADPIDLTNVGFDTSELKNADLRNADIAGSSWIYVNMEDADFRGVSSFRGASFYYTAWWRAAYLDPPLLDYLAGQAAFVPSQMYNTQSQISAETYAADLKRLAERTA